MDNSYYTMAQDENDVVEELATPMARKRFRLSLSTSPRKRLRTITELALAYHHTSPERDSTYLQDYLLSLDLSGQVARLQEGFYSDRHGGFGDVWEGEMMNQKVAIKVLRRASEDKVKQKAVKEVYNWSRLKHKNIQQFLGYCWDFGNFISMISPWQANGSARSFLIGKCLADIFRVMTGAAQGLAYLHSHGLIHGDFKGDNILISIAGQAQVTDFGLSHMIDDQYVSSSGPGGNYAWMSPELFDPGSEAIHTKASDVWACGMTVLELFSGQKPFHQCRNDAQIITQVARGVLPLRNPNITDELWELCTTCWNNEPSLRPEAYSVAEELRTRGPKTKALIISILYDDQTLHGHSLQIDNDHSAALELRSLLICNYGYDERDIKMLLEGEEQPTRSNMIRAMKDLVYNPQDGDRFFVFYSGLGSTSSQLERSEVESLVETLWPIDHLYEPNISGDELYDVLIRPVKDQNCRLTYIFHYSPSPYGGDTEEHSTFGSSSITPIDVIHTSKARISMDPNPSQEDILTKSPEDEYTIEPASRKLQRQQNQLLIKYLVTDPSTSVLRTMKKSSPKLSVCLPTDGSGGKKEDLLECDEDVASSPDRPHAQRAPAAVIYDEEFSRNGCLNLSADFEDFNLSGEARSMRISSTTPSPSAPIHVPSHPPLSHLNSRTLPPTHVHPPPSLPSTSTPAPHVHPTSLVYVEGGIAHDLLSSSAQSSAKAISTHPTRQYISLLNKVMSAPSSWAPTNPAPSSSYTSYYPSPPPAYTSTALAWSPNPTYMSPQPAYRQTYPPPLPPYHQQPHHPQLVATPYMNNIPLPVVKNPAPPARRMYLVMKR